MFLASTAKYRKGYAVMTQDLEFKPIKNTGSKHGMSKFTELQVQALRAEYSELCQARGKSRGAVAELARRHPEMSRQTIEFIVKRKIWRHC